MHLGLVDQQHGAQKAIRHAGHGSAYHEGKHSRRDEIVNAPNGLERVDIPKSAT